MQCLFSRHFNLNQYKAVYSRSTILVVSGSDLKWKFTGQKHDVRTSKNIEADRLVVKWSPHWSASSILLH